MNDLFDISQYGLRPNCYCICPLKIVFGEGRMPAASTFSRGLRSEYTDLPEVLRRHFIFPKLSSEQKEIYEN